MHHPPCLQVVGASALADYQLPCVATALFSSTASVWSQAGAAHYSASNCYLDALAHDWQVVGRPATAINFGPFGDTGMAVAFRQGGGLGWRAGGGLLGSSATHTAPALLLQ